MTTEALASPAMRERLEGLRLALEERGVDGDAPVEPVDHGYRG